MTVLNCSKKRGDCQEKEGREEDMGAGRTGAGEGVHNRHQGVIGSKIKKKKKIGRHAVKCYLECHLAHKDGGEDVVGDGEEDSFLDGQTGAGREGGEEEDIMQFKVKINSFMSG